MTDTLNAASNQSTGSLTSVMRAATPAGVPKVLRIGLVRGGKVLDERILGERDHLTIGPNEGATFVVPSRAVPPSFRLFERIGDHYRIQLTESMTGRVALAGGIFEIAALRAHASAETVATAFGPVYRARLPDEARGKIIIGDVTLLFQLVTPAPRLGKPQLPASLKGGSGPVDWRTSIIAAFSFLFHFGAVGSIYSDWMDPVVDDEVDAAQILESVRQLPAPPAIEHPKLVEAPSASSSAAARESPKPSPAGGGRAGSSGASGPRNAGDGRAHQLSSQLAALEMQVLTGLASAGSATSSVLGPSGDLPIGMLDKAAASSMGARPTGFALDLGGGHPGPLRPGALSRGPIPYETAPMATGAGSAAVVRPPSGSVAVPPPLITGGAVPNASSVVAGMSPGFRRCYINGLTREDPTMKGTVRITARIGPNGEVLSASAASSGTLSPTVVGCIRARVASAQFAPPEGGGAVLIIPVSTILQ